MGAAGGRTPSTTNGECVNIKRAPHKRPPFTLSQLKKAIPPHCFRRSLLRSSSYLLFDLSLSFLLFYLATTFLIPTSFDVARWWWWPVYWALQGCILTGVWVTGHECGHHAFSEYQWVDDAVGFALHSALLVPYFSWKYSHRRHHSNIGSLDRDEVFVPKTKSSLQWYLKYFNNAVGRALTLVATLLLGWPLYLAFNMSGRPYDRFACHFDPYSPIYSNRERFQVFISDVGVIAMSYFIYTVAASKGIPFVLCTYGVPLLIVNSFLVLITYLQHTHPALPHYSSSEWDWLRGALVTVDRDYGVLNAVFHHITDTHVVHHLFSTMPHYHAVEATRAVVPLLGEYYRFDSTPVVKALWREAKECLYVEPDDDDDDSSGATKGVFWYHNKF